MAAPQNVTLPLGFTLADGMQVRITALDATTGDLVTGVIVSNVSIDVDPLAGSGVDVKVPALDPDYFEGMT